MRVPLPEIEPVAIALDQIQTSGDVKFSGIDLESGAKVTVLIERSDAAPAGPPKQRSAHGLVLVLSIEALGQRS